MRFNLYNSSFEVIAIMPEAETFRDSFSLWIASGMRGGDYACFANATIDSLNLVEVSGYGTRWNNAILHYTTFKNCSLEGAIFTRTGMKDAEFIDCDLRRATFRDCDLSSVLFGRTNLGLVAFRNCTFDRQFDYRAAVRQGAVFTNCTGLVIPPEEHEVEGI